FPLLVLFALALTFGPLAVHASAATANLFVDVDGDEIDDFFQLNQVFGGPGTASIVGSDDQGIFGSIVGEFFDVNFSYDTSADVASGEIKVKTTFDNNSGQGLSTPTEAFGVFSSQGVLQDTLRFTSESGAPYEVVFNLDVTGSLNNSAGTAGNISAFLRATGFPSNQVAFTANGNHATTLSVTASLAGASASVDLFTSLSMVYFGVDDAARIDVDFSNTAALSVDLPEGVVLSGSDNGLLGAPTVVPVPAGFVLFFSGMVGLGLSAFRSTASQRATDTAGLER
ncbi:MAG: hypothetical protein ACI8XZ_002281, partial [Gammaproteobacteria bacterium]